MKFTVGQLVSTVLIFYFSSSSTVYINLLTLINRSLSICQFFDVKRKDFMEMMIHHNATILLMMFSWTGHFTRIGTLVMILHDLADPLLELAKMFRYANYRRTCDSIFAIFSLVWIITR